MRIVSLDYLKIGGGKVDRKVEVVGRDIYINISEDDLNYSTVRGKRMVSIFTGPWIKVMDHIVLHPELNVEVSGFTIKDDMLVIKTNRVLDGKGII